uniref:C2H2-type domain-containing protein n=1 Tax=Stomoxys calcitrans TaxID=35570 RepID=A0A1I8PMN1_STOCA
MPPGGHMTSDSDIESVLSMQVENPKSRRNSTGEKYFCSVGGCKQSFKRLDHLDRHEYKHTGIKKHACHFEGCEKIYSILTHLKRHIRTTHERNKDVSNKTVPCEVDTCDKMFTSLTNMHRHIREVHENPKVYKCQFCEEKFSQKLKMRRHEISKHTKTFPHTCEKCSKGFYQEWQWRKHIEACKVYPCLVCHKKFDKWTLFLKHGKESQHGSKYYKCEFCESAYVKPSDLQKHVAAKHFSEGDKSGEYKCPHEECGRSYAYERNLRQHITTSHEGKKYECTETNCDKEFSSLQNLQKHIKRDHAPGARKPTITKKKDTKTLKRKKRKDAGISKVSNLAKLSGLAVDPITNKKLKKRDAKTLEIIAEQISQEHQMEDTLSECDNSFNEAKEKENALEKNNSIGKDLNHSNTLTKLNEKENQIVEKENIDKPCEQASNVEQNDCVTQLTNETKVINEDNNQLENLVEAALMEVLF